MFIVVCAADIYPDPPNGRWGNWILNKDSLELEYRRDGNFWYGVDIEQLHTHTDLLREIMIICVGKVDTFILPEDKLAFIHALSDIFGYWIDAKSPQVVATVDWNEEAND